MSANATVASEGLNGAVPGVRGRSVGGGEHDPYYHNSRPELRALVPPHARRALDVGCGAGALGGALKLERAIEVVGIELFAEAAALASERLDGVIQADLEQLTELPYPGGSFDVMFFGDILEHLHDPHRLLQVLRRYLAPTGSIICSIPNVKHWTVVFALLVQDRWEYEDQGLLDRTHVRFFTLEEIRRMLDETGFEVHHVAALMKPLPTTLRPLAELAAGYGAELEDTVARLGAFQYLIAASPRPAHRA